MFREGRRLLLLAGLLALLPLNAFANVVSPCPRPAAGSVVGAPPELFSRNGVLNVVFNYFTTVDAAGRTLFCFMTADGLTKLTSTGAVAGSAHFADADNVASVARGKLIYMTRCASCHGRRLQGQPLWQLEDSFAGRRAPAHVQTGNTWQHSDGDLFRMTRDGRFPSAPSAAPSYMPAFRHLLTTQQIIAAIAFIKASWPMGLRISQATLNPGNRGMPAHAADVDWTLPPTCTISAQRWRETSR